MVNKFTNQPTIKEVAPKINEVIDAMGTVKSVNNASPDSNGNVSLTIPTVNNATLTIQKNGTTVKTFTANASSNVTCNITVPTDTSDLTNGAGFTTNVGTVTKVNNTSPDSNGNVTISIPTVPLEGVQINGTDLTITSKKVNIPLSGTNTLGVAKANAAYGVYNNSGTLTISKATDSQVTAKTNQYRPLVPYNIDLAVKTGVTTNSLTLTSAEQTAAQNWLGISGGGGGGANTDLSNLSATGKGVIDGQWVGKYAQDVISATATNSYKYDISSYLPTRTNETYLIYGHMSVISNNSTVFTVGKVASPYTNRTNNSSYAALVSANTNSRTAQSTFILPIASTDTYIYAQITGSAASTGCYINLLGYRRIGTNT